MWLSSIFQRAGANSTQTSVQTVNVYNGVTEERAREICREEYAVVARDMTREAIEIADERVGQLADKLLSKMAMYDKKLSAFADPSFQMALRKAQMSAACTSEESDYELLSELLLERIKAKEDKGRQLGVTKALEIVGQVSDDALLGLAVMYIAISVIPADEDLHQALYVYNQAFANVIGNMKLPVGDDWLEDLDLLGAVRIGNLGIKKSQKYFSEAFSDHLVAGVEKDSEEYNTMKSELLLVGLPADEILIPHPLKPNFVKFYSNHAVTDIIVIEEINGELVYEELSTEQYNVLEKVAKKLRQNESKHTELQRAFMKEWNRYPYLKMLREWWDLQEYGLSLTSVGLALANAYTRTIDPSIPKLD